MFTAMETFPLFTTKWEKTSDCRVTVVYPNCSSTTWIFNSIELVGHGVIRKNSGRAERLSLGSDCSLIVLSVKTEDVGHYTCRQYLTEGGDQSREDAVVYLSVETNGITAFASTIYPIMKVTVGGAIGAVLLCLLAVIIIAHKKSAKNQKPNNDSLALTTDIVSNSTGNQQTHPTNENKDGRDDGPTYATINRPSQNKAAPKPDDVGDDGPTYVTINHHRQNKAAPKPDTQQEDMVTYASVNLSSSRRN
ncbi:uncharacterized protein LOC124468688 isoform X2 [Hypomesus transpacificus]|uniref:uncharacterized protein LOC124468688 isoform X2 n=1 Tax=Hypomesus transpacificus TaxID=137520 RepID=UPI001F076776|nr:uncharacterized protein LOC124468688 isoform X2 [Hypomesus transpacificus]